MSEPADEEVPQPSTEVVEEEVAKQVVDCENTEEHPPHQEEVEIQQDKEESAPEAQEVEEHPESVENGSPSQEEQQQEAHDEEEQPEKASDDSQDTVKMPMTDSPHRALEDEEMPSMVTISSTSRVDDSVSYNKQDEESKFVDVGGNSPKQTVRQEKDSDSDSVCVIDDDDDEEEEPNDYDDDEEDERNDRRRVRHHDDDEEESSYEEEYDGSSSEYSDDGEMDEDRYNDKYDRRHSRNDRRNIEEDIEDEDDEEDDCENDDDYNDEHDFGGGGSDDAVLRPNSNGLSRQQKERSASLQDLSLIQGSPPKNRHNVNPFSQKAIFERNQGKRKPYAHVESKVKKYIDDLAEQRRISNERRKKSIDETRNRNDDALDIQVHRSEEVILACQTMKNYAEKTLKEVAESEENEKMIFLQQGVENGEISLIPRQSMTSQNAEIVNKAQEMEIDLIEDEDEKTPTFNGAAPKENQNNFVTERKGIMRRENGPPKSSILNGEDPLSFQPIDNLRTLSYDEYMRGSSNDMNEVVINRIEINEVQSIQVENAEIEDDSGLRIESVVSNYSTEKAMDDFQNRKTPPMMVNQSTETFYQENPEIQNLKVQLNQRNQQFESLREAYQKTMSDNMAMRMELENLRKTVAYYQEQQKSPRVETKVSAVQTEIPANSRDMPLIDLDGDDPKLGVSAVSTQWSDTTGSVATISMDPPNVTTALNSDESCQPPKTPVHKRNALSRAFMTSTKILQTLSSITYGKTKVDKVAKPPKINEAEKPSKPGPSSSKKRKASDTLDDSTQPTKIPHLSKSTDQEGSESTAQEPKFVNPNAMEQEKAGASTEKKDDGRQEESTSDDDVKVYVYPDDEGGHEHSFLIQAKEVSDNPRPGVRECGPYLLGNVEVYMTEVNGTINIWGKELSQTSQTSQATVNTEDLNSTARSRELRQNLRWQSTPRIFNKPEGVSASTSKKSRYLPRYAQPSQESHCEHNQRLSSWSSCHEHQQHQHHHHQHQHSCCSPPVVRVEAPCGCVHEQQRTPDCCKAKSMPNMNQNCCCSGHKPLARRHSFNPTDEEDSDEEDDANRTLTSENCFPHSFNKTKTMHPCSAESRRNSDGSPTEPSNLCENESDPLIGLRQTSDGFEAPEKKRKKKVRGLLMELLKKGCVGDCRTNPLDKTNLHHTTSIYEPSTSTQQRAPCLPSQAPPSHHANERCSSCTKPDKTSQIEAQMERFKEEMDKLRSRSDTLAGMIEALKSADVIN